MFLICRSMHAQTSFSTDDVILYNIYIDNSMLNRLTRGKDIQLSRTHRYD